MKGLWAAGCFFMLLVAGHDVVASGAIEWRIFSAIAALGWVSGMISALRQDVPWFGFQRED